VKLKSGGYLVINQTEALVAIDVNSGKSTKEHNIEDTAVSTNLEAADEIARQLRLRDLAGLIVCDFIDMEENRNNRAVEKRMKDALKSDRARIQVGRISHFGLLEMSRQRIRTSLLESTMEPCPHCAGTGHIRASASVALHVLRGVEEYLLKNTTHDITVRATAETTLYMLNHKRDTIVDLENRFGVSISFAADEAVGAQHFAIDRGAAVETPVNIDHITVSSPAYADDDEDVEISEDETGETAESAESQEAARGDERNEDGSGRKRRRRRRRGGRKSETENGNDDERAASSEDGTDDADADNDGDGDNGSSEGEIASSASDGDGERRGKRRRRGKRGGRRNREDDGSAAANGDTTRENAATDAGERLDPEQTGSGHGQIIDAETGDADEPAAAAGNDAQPEQQTPAKPARRRRRTKAQIAADHASKEAVTAETADATGEPETAAVDNKAEAADARDAEAATDSAATAPEAADETAVAEDEDGAKAEEDRRRRTDLAAIATAPVVTSSNKPDEAEKAEKPKKAGWWQKRGFF
jgi:ribonuclease E